VKPGKAVLRTYASFDESAWEDAKGVPGRFHFYLEFGIKADNRAGGSLVGKPGPNPGTFSGCKQGRLSTQLLVRTKKKKNKEGKPILNIAGNVIREAGIPSQKCPKVVR